MTEILTVQRYGRESVEMLVSKRDSGCDLKNLTQSGRRDNSLKKSVVSCVFLTIALLLTPTGGKAFYFLEVAMKTFDLKQAADFLKIHPETMRQLAISKEIEGAKIGRKWVFLERELVRRITGQYSKQGGLRLVVDNTKEQTKLWQSIKEKTTKATVTTSISSRQTASEYDNLLGLATSNKRKNSMTA